MLRACCYTSCEQHSFWGSWGKEHTLSAPINPNTLNTFAKCRYQLKLLARWYASSGSWANSIDDRTLLVSVAIATTRVIALFKFCISFLL